VEFSITEKAKIARISRSSAGPRYYAGVPRLSGSPLEGKTHRLPSDEQGARFASLASIVRFKKGQQVYSDGDVGRAIFSIIDGVIKIYRPRPHGGEYVFGFHYPDHLFGLTGQGLYVNSAEAITSVTAYLLPLDALGKSKDSDLALQVIEKLYRELRHAQRHAELLAQKHALSRLAMFLQLQEHRGSTNKAAGEIYLPMDRSSIASYVGMTLAAVSRGFSGLVVRGIIKFTDRRHVQIIDREAFDALASDSNANRDPARA